MNIKPITRSLFVLGTLLVGIAGLFLIRGCGALVWGW